MNRNRPILWTSNFLLFTIVLIMAAENDNIAKDDPNIIILNEMLSHMDESVEPCLNFQNYSAKNILQTRPPPFIAKFQILFDELKDKVFEEGSLEVKMQRLYNICLADNGYTNKYPPEEARTLQQVENILGRSLSKYLEYFYGHSYPDFHKP